MSTPRRTHIYGRPAPWGVGLAPALALAALSVFAACKAKDKAADVTAGTALTLSEAARTLPDGKRVAVFELANGAVFEIALLDEEAPRTAANFAGLVEAGVYDGTAVRAADAAAVRIGDDEKARLLYPDAALRIDKNERNWVRGAALIAKSSAPGEFLILREDAPGLDADSCVFGGVVGSLDVTDRLRPGDVIKRARILAVER